MSAPMEVWPAVELRFQLDLFYDFKFINLRGYMMQAVPKAKEVEVDRALAAQAIQGMAVLKQPERGAFVRCYRKKEPSSVIDETGDS